MKIQPDQDAAVLCLSGGMDSTALLLRFLARGAFVYGIGFDYGQKHRIELDRLQANMAYLRERGLSQFEWRKVDLTSLNPLLSSALTSADIEMPLGHYEQQSMRSTFVPNRNAIFCSIAYAYALSLAEQLQRQVGLGLGVHAGDHAIYPDCRPEFYSSLWKAFQVGNWNSASVELEIPYLHLDKVQILVDAQESIQKLGLDFDTIFRNTCTSYQPDAAGRSHGLTGSDVERILAFHRCGLVDPIEYQLPWPDVVAQSLALESAFRAEREMMQAAKTMTDK